MAGPDVKIRSTVEKEISVLEHGQKVTRLAQVPSGAIGSGIRLHFTLAIINEGDEAAVNVVIDNPIPPGTVYAIGSATAEIGIIRCSADNGASFHSENEQLSAPGSCTDIQWVIDELPPTSGCTLGFQVIVGRVAMPENFWTSLLRNLGSLFSR